MELFVQSHWITATNYRYIPNLYLEFSESFRLSTPAASYILYICAQNNYAVRINGTLAAFGQYPDVQAMCSYDRLDLTRYMKSGDNLLQIVVYAAGCDTASYTQQPCSVIFEMYSDKELFLVSSRDTAVRQAPCWKSGNLPFFTKEKGYTFHYDFTQENSRIPYDTADFLEIEKPMQQRPVDRCIPKTRLPAQILSQGIFRDAADETDSFAKRMQTAFLSPRPFWDMTGGHLPPQTLPDTSGFCFNAGHYASGFDGMYVLLDLGRIESGYLTLDLELAESAKILVAYGEHLQDLRVRSSVGECNFACSVQGRRGTNRALFPFCRLCCRYIALHIYTDRCVLRYAGLTDVPYPLNTLPQFSCADFMHQKIYETCRHTLEVCLHDTYEYAPFREGGMNIADARMQMLCGYYVFGEYRHPAAALRKIAASLSDADFVSPCPGGRTDYFIPADNCYFVMALEEYVRHADDKSFAAELLYPAKRAVDALLGKAANTMGLVPAFSQAEAWNFYEWQTGLSGANEQFVDSKPRYDCPLNALLSLALRALCALFDVSERPREAQYYQGIRKMLNENIHNTFYDAKKEAYFSFYQNGTCSHLAELTQSLVLLAQIPASQAIADTVRKTLIQSKMLPTSLCASVFKYEALLQDSDHYAKTVFDAIAQNYGAMLLQGATTFYETQDGASAFSNAGSMCCGSSAYPAYLYLAYLCGFRATTQTGFSHHPTPLQNVMPQPHASVLTPKGVVSV